MAQTGVRSSLSLELARHAGPNERSCSRSESTLEIGTKVHVITRRLFEEDLRRHFVGSITGGSGNYHEVQGYAFIFQPGKNEWQRRPELRTRIFSLSSSGLIVNVIPDDIDTAALVYAVAGNRLVLTDNARFSLDINEFGASR